MKRITCLVVCKASLLGSLSGLALLGNAAIAQVPSAAPDQAPPAPSPTPPPADAGQTNGRDDRAGTVAAAPGEIVVTAQRKVERLQDVPISVAVVSGRALTEQGTRNLTDLSNYVPNLSITRFPGATQIILRGVGTGPGSPTIDQSVSMFIDGVYNGHARQFDFPLLDIERVEILRGPQGALVGRNTSAGAINITTRQPGDKLEGYVNAEYNFNLNAPKIEAAATIPLNDEFSIRGAAKYLHSDGWIRNSISGDRDLPREEKVGRLILGYHGSALTGALKGEYVDVVQHGGAPSEIVAPSVGRFLDLTKESGGSRYGKEFDNEKAQNVSLNLSLDAGYLTIASISAFSAYQSTQGTDADLFEKDLAYSTFQENYRQYSQELRLSSPAGERLEWAVGGYGQTDRMREQRTTNVTTAANANTYRLFLQHDDVASIYGQLTFRMSPKFWVIGGLRETYTRKRGDFSLYRGNDVIHLKTNTGPVVLAFGDRFHTYQFDPSVSAQFRPSSRLMFYASYGHGSKSGGFQGAISNAVPSSFQYDPESSRSIEGGMKASIPGLGYLNVAVFDTLYKNLQLSTLLPGLTNGVFTTLTSNAGSASVRGVEVDGRIRLTSYFSIAGNASYLPHAKYKSFVNATCYTGRVPTNPAIGSCDLSGARLPYAPKFAINLTPEFTAPLTEDLRFTTSVTFQHRTAAFTDGTDDPITIQRRFNKIDARIAVSSERRGLELALVGRNLTNRITSPYASAAPFAANAVLGIAPDARTRSVDLPRTIAVQASYKF